MSCPAASTNSNGHPWVAVLLYRTSQYCIVLQPWAAYRSVRPLPATEAAYIAGLIDGEGTITLTRYHRNENRRLVVSISNNERFLLEFVLRAVGAGRITTKRTYRNTHAPSYAYIVNNRQAFDLLLQVASYLQSYKAKRAELILQDYVRLTPRNGKYGPVEQADRKQFESDLLAIRVRKVEDVAGSYPSAS